MKAEGKSKVVNEAGRLRGGMDGLTHTATPGAVRRGALRRWVPVVAVALSVTGLLACGPSSSEEPASLRGYVTAHRELRLWPNPRQIPVCWEAAPPAEEDDEERQRYQQLIAEGVSAAYQKAGFGFVGWSPCPTSFAGIRMEVAVDGRDETRTTGALLAGIPAGLRLNRRRTCGEAIPNDACRLNTALHEFGHALGLHHEMNRRDHTDCAKDQTKGAGEPEALQVGPYDPASIMSYCRDRGGTTLSAGDVTTLQAYYRGPLAQIWGGPGAHSGDDEAYFKIQGPGIVAYRYLLALDPQECLKNEAYGEAQPADGVLIVTLRDVPRSRRVHLCVLGRDERERWQEVGAFSSVSWWRP